MYGTIAHMRFKEENRQALIDLAARYDGLNVDGFVSNDTLFPDGRPGEAYIVVKFRDKASYEANANDPAQHERFLEMRALLEADPEWTDGQWQ